MRDKPAQQECRRRCVEPPDEAAGRTDSIARHIPGEQGEVFPNGLSTLEHKDVGGKDEECAAHCSERKSEGNGIQPGRQQCHRVSFGDYRSRELGRAAKADLLTIYAFYLSRHWTP